MIHPNFARPFRRKGEGNGALRYIIWQCQAHANPELRLAGAVESRWRGVAYSTGHFHGGRATQTIIPIASQSIQYSGLILALRPFRVIAVDCQPRERVKKLGWLAPASQKREPERTESWPTSFGQSDREPSTIHRLRTTDLIVKNKTADTANDNNRPLWSGNFAILQQTGTIQEENRTNRFKFFFPFFSFFYFHRSRATSLSFRL